MLSILIAERPTLICSLPTDSKNRTVANAYWFGIGYEAAVQKLLSLAEPLVQEDRIEETFRDPDEEPNKWHEEN